MKYFMSYVVINHKGGMMFQSEIVTEHPIVLINRLNKSENLKPKKSYFCLQYYRELNSGEIEELASYQQSISAENQTKVLNSDGKEVIN